MNVTTESRVGFVGRAVEIEAAIRRLDGGARLVTVLGTGGIGKTRFAGEVAAQLRKRDELDVRFCELAGARTMTDLVRAVASSVRPTVELPEDPLEASELVAESMDQDMLLILDNLEQLLPEGAKIVEHWLRNSSRIRLLATSRQPLRLSSEERVELPPLSEEEGTALFLAKTAMLSSGTDEVTLKDVVQIVRRLDGIPLAIELAAARAPLLGTRQILTRLSEQLELLDHGALDRPDRQATLRNTIDWSWNLLSEEEKEVLAATAVFAGGFTVEACEAVVAEPVGEQSVLHLLQTLREKSLLQVVSIPGMDGERRLRHFEVILEYAMERLRESGRWNELCRRHADYFLSLAELLAERSTGIEGVAAQTTLSAEIDNLVAGHRRFSTEDPMLAARLVIATHEVLARRGPFSMHLELASSAIEAAERSGDPRLIAQAHITRVEALTARRRHDEAADDLEKALAAAKEVGDPALHAAVLRWMGIAAREDGCEADAERTFEEALNLARAAEDRLLEARLLSNLGTLRRFQLRDDEALDYYHRSLEEHQHLGNAQGELVVLGNIGHLHAASGRLSAALTAYRDALAHAPGSIDRRSEAIILAHLGGVEARLGRLEDAEAHERRALATFEALGDEPMQALTSAHLGAVAAARERLEEAERWFARSRRACIRFRDSGWRVACEVLHGLLYVAKAARARERGLPDESSSHLDAARAAVEAARASMEVGAVHSDHVRQAVERLEAALDRGAPESSRSKLTLTVAADGSWFAFEGEERVDLTRRRALGRVLCRLLVQRLAAPHEAVSLEDLLEAGWSGEKILPDAGKARVYGAVATLRRFGLADVLVTRDGGYLLHPAVPVTRA